MYVAKGLIFIWLTYVPGRSCIWLFISANYEGVPAKCVKRFDLSEELFQESGGQTIGVAANPWGHGVQSACKRLINRRLFEG
jgi:hypothetical protein